MAIPRIINKSCHESDLHIVITLPDDDDVEDVIYADQMDLYAGQMKEERVYSKIDLYRKHMFFK